MRKFGLKCPIRKANPYRRMMKATKEHSTCKNLVNRNLKTGLPYNVLLTDITYLFYGKNKKYYLSTIKDAINPNLSFSYSEVTGSNEWYKENMWVTVNSSDIGP